MLRGDFLHYIRWLVAILSFGILVGSIVIWDSFGGTSQTALEMQKELPVIIVDAGHGGIDSGTSGVDGTQEKNINLAIAQRLKDVLTLMGFRVVMTRTTDDLISDPSLPTIRQRKREDLMNRLQITDEHDHCVLVSIHQNYFTDSFYSGAQVFYSNNHPESKILAESIQETLRENLQPDNTRIIKQSGSEIYLLDQCKKTAVMVECGFMSNVKELSLLKSEKYQTKLAFSIALSLLSFYTE